MRMHFFKKKSLLRILKWFAVCVVLAAAGGHVLIKFLIGPAYVASRVEEALLRFWSGPVYAEDVEFNYDGIMLVGSVRLCDQKENDVIEANNVTLVLGNWPSLKSFSKKITVEQLDVKIKLDNGTPNLMFQFNQPPDSNETCLENLWIQKIIVSFEDNEARISLDEMLAEARKAGGPYEFNIGTSGDDDARRIRINGIVDLKTKRINTTLKLSQAVKREQTRMLLSAIGVSTKWDCNGTVRANLETQGNLMDSNSLWPDGMVTIENWNILVDQNTVGKEIAGTLFARKRHLDLEQINGIICKGRVTGNLYLDVKQQGPGGYGGDFLLTDISMAELTELMKTEKRFTRGTGRISFQFTADTNSIDSLKAQGIAFLDDADLWRFPLIGQLFKSIGIWEYQAGGMSDAEMKFNLSGPEMTIERGHLSNRFSAIEAEPGGKINLRSGQIDMFVVAAPLKDLEKLIGKIPVVNWFLTFKDKLVRLQIKGSWSNSPIKLVSKRPIKDVKDSTVEFFGSIIESGGQFTRKIIDTFGLVFNRKNNKTPAE